MNKVLLVLALSAGALVSHAQQSDTLIIFYKPGEYRISKSDKQKLDDLIAKQWDRIVINGYTDSTESDEYNIELSKKRSGAIYDYLAKDGANSNIISRFFGESLQRISSDEIDNRALNRRTEIISWRFRRHAVAEVKPDVPVTQSLDNGFIVTYTPGDFSSSFINSLANGISSNFRLITNTSQMIENGLYTNTTSGGVLSSVLVVCFDGITPCKLDKPIEVKVPININVDCPVEKIKFFNTVAEDGKLRWQEQDKFLYPEVINGQRYIRLLIDDFCSCINFDFKIEPECFDTDTTQIECTDATIKNLIVSLKGLNSVYEPRQPANDAYEVLHIRNSDEDARLTFSLYDGKRRVRSFRNMPMTAFPYDEKGDKYIMKATPLTLYFPKLDVFNISLKVNGDTYRPKKEEDAYEFLYLNRHMEEVYLSFSVADAKGRITDYRNKPIDLFQGETDNTKVIDKKFLKTLQSK